MFLKALRGHGTGESILSWNTIPPFIKGEEFEFSNFLQKGGLRFFS